VLIRAGLELLKFVIVGRDRVQPLVGMASSDQDLEVLPDEAGRRDDNGLLDGAAIT
jgi:hypothetical protein